MQKIRMVALALGALLLSACGFIGHDIDPFDLDNGKNAGQVACDEIVDVSNAISAIDALPNGDHKRADGLIAWNVDLDQIAATKAALDARSDECHGETPAASSSASASTQPLVGTGTPIDGDCPAQFVQKFDPNEKGNFSSEGIEGSDDVLSLMGKDARYLAFVGNLTRPSDVKNDARPLLAKDNASCLSQEGRETFYLIKGTLTAKDVKVNEDAKAPKDSYNTAMQNDRGVVDPHRGIGGNRDAVQYEFPNGNKLSVLKRCGNPALKGPGTLPKGPTDHQRPPTKTSPPPASPSSPPPGDEEGKNPHEAPGNGGPGDGGAGQYGGNGSDRQTADPKPSGPAAGKPPATYDPPDPPKENKPPAGSKPTQTPAPPPAEPSAGETNTGDPGGW